MYTKRQGSGMGIPWHVLYYQNESGACELRDFIDSRKPEEQGKIFTWISAQVPLDQIKKALKMKADIANRFRKGEALYDSFSRPPRTKAQE
jgi:hypothetical protein